MILARQTCFWGLLRSATTASRRARSAAETSTVIPSRIRPRWGRLGWKGTNRLGHSTSSRHAVQAHAAGPGPPARRRPAGADPALDCRIAGRDNWMIARNRRTLLLASRAEVAGWRRARPT